MRDLAHESNVNIDDIFETGAQLLYLFFQPDSIRETAVAFAQGKSYSFRACCIYEDPSRYVIPLHYIRSKVV